MDNARQLVLFAAQGACLSISRLQRRTRHAMKVYSADLPASFPLRSLAEEQARLELLRAALRRARREAGSGRIRRRGSSLALVEAAISPDGVRLARAIARCAARVEALEAQLLCA